ncbi:MAG: alpha-galactosidase [Halanaerobiales bacterium]|nr:alpha-galactosidase [Halanaerobiales bacterium]
MQKAMVYISWEREGIKEEINFSIIESYTHHNLSVNISREELKHGHLYSVQLKPNNIIKLKHLSIRLTPEMKMDDKMLVNGYQNWSESMELGSNDRIRPIKHSVKQLNGTIKEEEIFKTPKKPGHFHSWTYTYFHRTGIPNLMMGSIDESFALTAFKYNFHENQLVIEKELNYLLIENDSIPFQIYMGEGTENALWNEYTSLIPNYNQSYNKVTGWTSSNANSKINEEIVLDNLNALNDAQIPLDVFLIDHGYQKFVGDWLETNKQFPYGMKHIAQKIKEKGYRPGIWLAPFICDEKSSIYKNNPQWLLRNSKDQPIKVGKNPIWKGWAYALDFYSPGFKDHLRRVFNIIFEWGYEFIKLDFLYAAALRSHRDKTKGQILSDVLTFIKELAGERIIFGNNLPIGSAIGQLDICPIGNGISSIDKNKINLNSFMNAFLRSPLNGKAFLNDNDRFILRDEKGTISEINKDQRYTRFVLNNLLGGSIFFSDYIDEYTPDEMKLLKSMYPKVNVDIVNIIDKDYYHMIKCNINDKEYTVYINFKPKTCKFYLDQPSFSEETGFLSAGAEVELRSHQTICFHKVNTSPKLPYLLGSFGHIFPGAQVESYKAEGEEVEISLVEGNYQETEVFIGVPNRYTNLKVNGKFHSVKLTNRGSRYVCAKLKNS